ncbi:hypothetical protein [Methylobacterium iners]|uniref:Cellulose biosynthesis protein BcsS n=1 Tax=Methylobacterium iners TaxID=418707 RepID=A0ABQ4S4I4_9HYPH|nr:hypothetical protein [Methylobacterium iners]GJD97989.1 hypothetical protein OCOJLMKI_5228 [Methylobacterium iners]
MLGRFPPAAVIALHIGLLGPGIATAQDEPITLADDPFEITDPNATPVGEAVFAIGGSYERAPSGRVRNTYGAETEIGFGIAPDLDLRIGQSGAYGNLDIGRRLGTIASGQSEGVVRGGRAELGGVTQLGSLYQVSREQGAAPAVGLLGRVRALYGPEGTAYETDAIALFGKTLVEGERPLGISLNAGLISRIDPGPSDRPHRYLVNVSVGQAISRDTALVASYAREQQERGDQDFSLAQIGLRHRLRSQKAIVGVAIGFGLNQDTPQYQVAVAVQWEIGGQ